MTPPVPPVDPGNVLLAAVPSQLSLSQIDTPAGSRLVLTIRTPCTTLSLLLTKEEAEAWGAGLASAAGTLSAAGLVVAGPQAMKGETVEPRLKVRAKRP